MKYKYIGGEAVTIPTLGEIKPGDVIEYELINHPLFQEVKEEKAEKKEKKAKTI